ncbi:50S ribosomal protein L9 [Ectothiorhodospiraceae bacterium BW-2]|nr:50S ribosomal protein L9 [Ectothiorhodospiraceae bacterium BW-2]
MEIILLQKIRNLGALGEQVRVKPGYARNFLIPSGRAIMATKANIEKFQARRAELEKRAADEQAAAQSLADKVASLGSVSIAVRAGGEGKLFGSVSANDVAEAVQRAGIEIDRRQVRMPAGENSLRSLGEHEVILHLHGDIDQPLTVAVVPE